MAEQTASGAIIQWDYQVLTMHARHDNALEVVLKERGTDGWELVFLHTPLPYEYQCVFRKPLAG
ncbi:MAG: hypothetical protein ABJA67_17430 [Chthonomonadales bacterium]